jgi:hypothetical protein
MKKIIAIALLILWATITNGQTKTEKVKVILFGTFHMRATSDKNKTEFSDIFSDKRQAQFDSVAQSLNNYGINKYFVEIQSTEQKWLDDWFTSYKKNTIKTQDEKKDEIIQVIFRAAAKDNAKLCAIDFKQELPYDKIDKYDQKHKNDTVNIYPFFNIEYPFTLKRKTLEKATLTEYFIQLNNEYGRKKIMFDYLHYALGYGENSDYLGVDLTKAWYERNLKIFTNILRQIDTKNDKVVVVFMGAAHTAMLRQFFQNHPMFEIVELENVLK